MAAKPRSPEFILFIQNGSQVLEITEKCSVPERFRVLRLRRQLALRSPNEPANYTGYTLG